MPSKTIPPGTVFTRLTVFSVGIPIQSADGWNKSTSICGCQCGTIVTVRNETLKNGMTKSCGCLNRELTTDRNYKHGHRKSSSYDSWSDMKRRCTNPNRKEYDRYGGRGITVCDRWKNSFENFFQDMGERPEGLSLERINNSLGYYKENCKWDTDKNQARNRRSNIKVNVRGVEGCLVAVCEHFGVNFNLVRERIRRGWDIESAFFKPRYHRHIAYGKAVGIE